MGKFFSLCWANCSVFLLPFQRLLDFINLDNCVSPRSINNTATSCPMDLAVGHCLFGFKDSVLKEGTNPRYEHFPGLNRKTGNKEKKIFRGHWVSTLFPPKTNKVNSFSPYCCSCVICVYHVFMFVYSAFYIKTAWRKKQVCLYCSLKSGIMKLMPASRHLSLYILLSVKIIYFYHFWFA